MRDADDGRLPDLARTALAVPVAMLKTLQARITGLDREPQQWRRSSPVSRRLGTIPGAGPPTATALTAAPGDGRHYRSGRQFAASSGLVPRQFGTGGILRLGRISQRGDGYRRRNLVHGARAALSCLLRKDGSGAPPLRARVAARSMNLVAVAAADRNARIARAMVRRGQPCQCGGADDGGLIRARVTAHRARLQESMMAQLDPPGTGQPRVRFRGAEPAGQIGNRFTERHRTQRSAINRIAPTDRRFVT